MLHPVEPFNVLTILFHNSFLLINTWIHRRSPCRLRYRILFIVSTCRTLQLHIISPLSSSYNNTQGYNNTYHSSKPDRDRSRRRRYRLRQCRSNEARAPPREEISARPCVVRTQIIGEVGDITLLERAVVYGGRNRRGSYHGIARFGCFGPRREGLLLGLTFGLGWYS